MKTLVLTLIPRSPFGTPLKGDTLFGQVCWAVLHRQGESYLKELLQGYTQGKPFLVISDAFPKGHLPRPALPLHRFTEVPDADRKQVKKRSWLPRGEFARPLNDWLRYSVSERDIHSKSLIEQQVQPHNTLNRMTGTTGTGEFAPYVMPQQWFAPELSFDIYIAYAPERIERDVLKTLLEDIGATGYGRDASIGLGKFEVVEIEEAPWPAQNNANAWMTLAPCAPQGLEFDPENCWYQPFTRFGRHGDRAVHTGKPFKTPVLMADTAALLKPRHFDRDTCFSGQGLGGDGSLSNAILETVHQGYAPVLPVRMEETS